VQIKSMVAVVVGIVIATQAFAEESGPRATAKMARKWARGVTNTLTGIVELPVQTGKGWNKGVTWVEHRTTSQCLGAGMGLFRGIGHGTGRTWFGLFEMVTCWAANPEDNAGHGVALDNEYSWDTDDGMAARLDKDSKGYQKMGRKFWRGTCNTFMGASEFSYQIGQETKSPKGSILSGVGAGCYMFVSRELSGVNDMVTFVLPNPELNVGVSFEIPDPWNYLLGEEAKP